jgi:putative NIF3 family GTP cyclohydrolase 1 type 2
MLIKQIVEQIRKSGTATALHTGSPDSEASGIAVTYTPTLEVLRKAVASGRNLIVTREGPYWNRKADAFAANPTFVYKRDFIEKNHLAILQLRDDPEDRSLRALGETLGWSPAGNIYFKLPQGSLEALARSIEAKLGIHAARVIGDPRLVVSKVALTHGRMMVPALQKVLQEPDLDAVVIGEPIEWEASPYFQDLIVSGQKKGLIAIGLEASEEPGGKLVTARLKTLVPDVPVEWIPAGEPFTVLT